MEPSSGETYDRHTLFAKIKGVFAEICRDGAGSEADIYPDANVVEESWRAEVESECRATSGAASEERPSIGDC